MYAKTKRKSDGYHLTVEQHCIDTENVSTNLFKKEFLDDWLKFWKISKPDFVENYIKILRLSCLFHDIGKANEEFQKLANEEKVKQLVRHEHYSALFLMTDSASDVLKKSLGRDCYHAIIAAVISHHMKISPPGSNKYSWMGSDIDGEQHSVRLYSDHPQILNLLKRGSKILGDEISISISFKYWDIENSEECKNLFNKFDYLHFVLMRNTKKDKEYARFVMSLKCAVMLSDSVASGMVREDMDINDFIERYIHNVPCLSSDFYEKIIKNRIGENATYKEHQTQAYEAGISGSNRVCLAVSCGGGKTIGSYLWAKGLSTRYPHKHILFLSPTRATATEIYKHHATEDGRLLHSSSLYDLVGMQKTLDDDELERQQKLFALHHWGCGEFVATVDQFISFICGNYKAICLLPIIMRSVIVLDEIHSYDHILFSNIIEFLENFDVPVIALTGTLINEKEKILKNNGFSIIKNTGDENCKTHEIIFSEGDIINLIEKNADKNILCIVNKVADAQNIAKHVYQTSKRPLLCYHSRYRVKDRAKIHGEAMSFFQKHNNGILVATQVCEMSMDTLDADILISEICVAESEVQRIFRLRRDNKSYKCYFIMPNSVLPYSKEEIEIGKRLIDVLSGRKCSKKEIEEELLRITKECKQDGGKSYSSFWDAGLLSRPDNFREGSPYMHECILDTDLETVIKLLKEKDPNKKMKFKGYIVSTTEKLEDLGSSCDLPPWLFVAPGYKYFMPHINNNVQNGFGYEK